MRSSIEAATIGADGIGLYAVLGRDDEPIRMIDLAEMRELIAEWYAPMSDRAFRVFAAAIRRRGWGRRKLIDATNEFLERRFPRWTPGDFLGTDPRLYPARWYRMRVRENVENCKRIGWYKVAGCNEPLCGWIEEIGDTLPRWEFPKNVPAPSTPPSAAPISHAMPLELELVKKLSLRDCRIEDLEEEVRRLERELASAHEVIDQQSQALIEVRHILASLQRGYAPIDSSPATAGDMNAARSYDPAADGYPMPIDIDAAEGPNARMLDRLFHGVRGHNVGIHRISMSPGFHAQVLRSVRLAGEHPQYVYGILYEVIADQQEDFLLWDVAGGLLSLTLPGTDEL